MEMITVAHELEFIFEIFFFTLKLESLWIVTLIYLFLTASIAAFGTVYTLNQCFPYK